MKESFTNESLKKSWSCIMLISFKYHFMRCFTYWAISHSSLVLQVRILFSSRACELEQKPNFGSVHMDILTFCAWPTLKSSELILLLFKIFMYKTYFGMVLYVYIYRTYLYY